VVVLETAILEHVFEHSPAAELNAEGLDPALDPAWEHRECAPDDPAYLAYLAYEDQQIAFWSAYAASEVAPDDLLNLNPARTDGGLLHEIERQAQRVNAAEGAKLRAIADYALRMMANPRVGYDEEFMRRSVEAEVACMLKLPPSTAGEVLGSALMLARRLPGTLAMLERGELSRVGAETIADESANLTGTQCAQLEDEVLPSAGQRSHRSLRHHVRRAVEKLDADAVRKRAEKAREERTLYVKPGHDGMATLCAVLPRAEAQACFDAINDKVLTLRASRQCLGIPDDRHVGAHRVDTLVDLLVAALKIDLRAPVAPVSSALTAEQIADLDKGADSYTPSAAMKRAIRARDRHCRFPGCRRPAVHCDVDHTIAFMSGGRTVYANLGAICRFHHQIKHSPGWHLAQDDRARFTWTTPNGLRFITRPPPAGSDDPEGDEAPDFGRTDPADDEIPF
jgi:hypothetical protein